MNGRSMANLREDVSIVLCGSAGQGVQTVEHILTQTLKLSGYHVFSTEEYMSRIRGGSNSTLIRVSSKRVSAYVDRIDLLIPFSPGAVTHVRQRISPRTVLLGEKKVFGSEYHSDKVIDVPLSEIASQVGGPIYSNTVAVGLIAGLFRVEGVILKDYLRHHFSGKDDPTIRKNIDAAQRGYAVGRNLLDTGKLQIEVQKNARLQNEIIIDGVEALGKSVV